MSFVKECVCMRGMHACVMLTSRSTRMAAARAACSAWTRTDSTTECAWSDGLRAPCPLMPPTPPPAPRLMAAAAPSLAAVARIWRRYSLPTRWQKMSVGSPVPVPSPLPSLVGGSAVSGGGAWARSSLPLALPLALALAGVGVGVVVVAADEEEGGERGLSLPLLLLPLRPRCCSWRCCVVWGRGSAGVGLLRRLARLLLLPRSCCCCSFRRLSHGVSGRLLLLPRRFRLSIPPSHPPSPSPARPPLPPRLPLLGSQRRWQAQRQ